MKLVVALIMLHGPDNQIIWLNPSEVVAMRALRDAHVGHLAAGVGCTIQTADGRNVNVAEDCDAVEQMIGIRP